ncbi:hypothetical protein AUP68_06466 [Ilyonectria robusta]
MNTLNPGPTTSIADLLPPGTPPLHIESLIARILTRLESNYAQFLRDGFSSDLETRYYRHWLHSAQNIRLESEGGLRARVLGITSDWGMLRVEELREDGTGTGKSWALQNDENSFDYWKGLPLALVVNGMKYGSILLLSSGSSHRSGLKVSGSGNRSPLWCAPQIVMDTLVSPGIHLPRIWAPSSGVRLGRPAETGGMRRRPSSRQGGEADGGMAPPGVSKVFRPLAR